MKMTPSSPPFLPGHLFHCDPTCREIDGRFWVFCTHDQSSSAFQAPEDYWDNMYSYQAYSTADFEEWVSHGSILSRFDIDWADANALWDGDAGIKGPDGKFYAYMPFRCVSQRTGKWSFKMAVMVADQPEGPYRDALGRPFLTDEDLLDQGFELPEGRRGNLCLSPTVTYDESGAPWLLFGQFKAFIAPLAPTMTALAGPIRELDIPLKGGEAVEYIEGPMLDHIAGRWRFTYMTYKNWQGKPNRYFDESDPEGPYIQVCESDSMFGPFSNPKHWIYPYRPDDANIQHCLARFGERWIVAYHLPWKKGSQHRRTAITEVHLDAAGNLMPIHPENDTGLGEPTKRHLILSAKGKRFAQEFSEIHKGELIQGPLKSHHVRLQPGGWIKFPQMRFDGGETKVSIGLLPSETDRKDCSFEIRLNSPEGMLVGQAAEIRGHDKESVCCFTIPIVDLHDFFVANPSDNSATLSFHYLSIHA